MVRVMTWDDFLTILRGTANNVLDALGINDSTISTIKRTSRYNELGRLLNKINHEIETNDMKISDLKTALMNESPLGIAYRKINNQINAMTKQNKNMKEISRQAQYHMAKVDNSDIFDGGSTIKAMNNYATHVENYFKE